MKPKKRKLGKISRNHVYLQFSIVLVLTVLYRLIFGADENEFVCSTREISAGTRDYLKTGNMWLKYLIYCE